MAYPVAPPDGRGKLGSVVRGRGDPARGSCHYVLWPPRASLLLEFLGPMLWAWAPCHAAFGVRDLRAHAHTRQYPDGKPSCSVRLSGTPGSGESGGAPALSPLSVDRAAFWSGGGLALTSPVGVAAGPPCPGPRRLLPSEAPALGPAGHPVCPLLHRLSPA